MSAGVRQKDPASTVNFTLDYADHLGELGGLTITGSTWTVPPGITQVAVGLTATTTTIRLTGGTDGQDYEIVNHFTLSDGQEDEKSLTIQVRQAAAAGSSDAIDRANAISVLIDLAQDNTAPTLTESEVERILDRCKLAATWTANRAYNIGDRVVPTIRNNYFYVCVQPGTAQSAGPGYNDFPRIDGQCFSDGSSDPVLIWEAVEGDLFNPGIHGEERNVYDINKAARECCLLHARKSAQIVDDGNISFSQLHEHWTKEAEKFRRYRRATTLVRC